MTRNYVNGYPSDRTRGLMTVYEYSEAPHGAECYDALNNKYHNFEIDGHQLAQLLVWMDGRYLIQEVAPSLNEEQREMCISGLNNKAFDKAILGVD